MAVASRFMSSVKRVESFGSGVYQVAFEVPLRYRKFKPGQFLHLALDDFDPTDGYWPESRVFSIASLPSRDELIIVYSVKGSFTQRMEKELVVGRQLWLKLPFGDFIITEDLLLDGPVVLIAGGTGISPFLPFIFNQANRSGEVHLFYGVRRPEHILARDDLMALREAPWFHLHLFIEEGNFEGISVVSGRLSVSAMMLDLGRSFSSAQFFLSGPPSMIQGFRDELKKKGIEPKRIHSDEWE